MILTNDELELLTVLENALNENLMLISDFFGCLFTDSAVSKSFLQRSTLKNTAPNSFIREDIELLADRINRLWKQPIRNSANLLQQNAKNIFEKRQNNSDEWNTMANIIRIDLIISGKVTKQRPLRRTIGFSLKFLGAN